MSKMYCHECGSEVTDDMLFCSTCGAKLHFSKKKEENTPKDSKPPIDNKEEAKKPSQNQMIPYSKEAVDIAAKGVYFADPGERVIAYIIDSIIIDIFLRILISIFAGPGPAWRFIGIQDWWKSLIYLAYFWYTAYNGQSIGKYLLGLRVVDETTYQQLDPVQALIHAVGKAFFLPLDLIIGLIIGETQKEQIRIMQKVARSVVLKIKK